MGVFLFAGAVLSWCLILHRLIPLVGGWRRGLEKGVLVGCTGRIVITHKLLEGREPDLSSPVSTSSPGSPGSMALSSHRCAGNQFDLIPIA